MVQCWQTQRHCGHGLYIARMLKVSALLLFIDYWTIQHSLIKSQCDLISRARTGGTGWPGPLGEVWEAWAGLLLAGKTFTFFLASISQFSWHFPIFIKILSLFTYLEMQARYHRCKERGPESSLGGNRRQASFKYLFLYRYQKNILTKIGVGWRRDFLKTDLYNLLKYVWIRDGGLVCNLVKRGIFLS